MSRQRRDATPGIRARLRRVLRPWRAAFALYAIALTVGTHWPELRMGAPAAPAPDKLLHMLAFGGLAFLFLQSHWVRPPWVAGLVVLLWTTLDELSQALPGVRRTISFYDMLAGQLGVIVVVTWWWALGPVGATANRARLAWQAFVIGDLFSRIKTWLLVGAAGVVGAAVVGGVTLLLVRGVFGLELRDPATTLMAAAFAGAVAAAHTALVALTRRRAIQLRDTRPCVACGTGSGTASFDEFGRGRCVGCGEPVHRGQWTEPMELPLRAVLRGALPAAVAAGALLGIGMLAFGAVLILSQRVPIARDLIGWWQDLPTDLQVTIDLAGIGLALAVAVRLYRQRQAGLYDGQHVQCRGCGQNLSKTPIERGCGRCGECGMPFARYPEHPAAVKEHGGG